MFPPETDLEIAVAEAAALLAAGARVRLVDCREEDEFAYCRLPGADCLPLSRFAEECSRPLPVPGPEDTGPDGAIIVYCHHGMRSLSATRFLRQRGHRRVWSLRGGIDAWAREIDASVPRY